MNEIFQIIFYSSTEPVALAFLVIESEGCDNEKPPIIFVHGVSACKEFWRDIPQNVAKATKRKVSIYFIIEYEIFDVGFR